MVSVNVTAGAVSTAVNPAAATATNTPMGMNARGSSVTPLSGRDDEAADRLGRGRRDGLPREHGVERVAQIVRRHDLARRAERDVEVVDPSVIPDGAGAVDHHGLRRD